MTNTFETEYFTINEASLWASNFFGKKITPSNITYLINYGKIKRINQDSKVLLSRDELENYYNSINKKENNWKKKLGDDLNWALSFDNIKEAETTKHVHRLHPYKGKYIPQLVEYFLDSHVDDFKKEVYFKKGNVVLDPFCGSGTTLVQANEMGIHAIGIDISEFNTLIGNVKLLDVDKILLNNEINELSKELYEYVKNSKSFLFENKLIELLNDYNLKYFPVPKFNLDVKSGKIDKIKYTKEKTTEFLKIYYDLVKKFDMELIRNNPGNFLEKWYLAPVLNEIYFLYEKIKSTNNIDIFKIILSRTIRSCRATTHYDLGTLKNPIIEPYYCNKHYRICKPLFSIFKWWNSYSKDTLTRLMDFKKIRTNTRQICITGDSRNIDLTNVLKGKKIDGIFSSPPYVGLIDYHEQHAYAYDLFSLKRNDKNEIGPLFKGKGIEAQKSYVKGISDVLNNCKKYLKDDYNIFLVANDNYNLYPEIARLSNMKIIEQFKRPVLNRIEGKEAYCEIIFRLKNFNN